MRALNRKFFTSATIAGAAFVMALSPFGLSMAQDQDLSISYAAPVAEVSIGAQYIDVDPNVLFDQAVLRVAGPDGYALTRTVSGKQATSYITADLLLDAEPARQGSSEEPVPWNQLPDGRYYFEIQLHSADGSTERQSGYFRVEGGIAAATNQKPLSATQPNTVIKRVAGIILDWLIPTAHANHEHGDFNDFVSIRNVSGTGVSRLNLNATNSIVVDGNTWRLANDADTGHFIISQGAVTNRFVLTQGGNVGLGTDAPLSPLHINRLGGFQIRLTGSGADYRMDAFGTSLRIGHASNTNQFRIFGEDAQFNSLVIRGAGVGFGTETPAYPIHVKRADSSAQFRVEDTGASNVQTMFTLENNGHTRFRMRNAAQDVNWDFRTAGSGATEQFQITRFSTADGSSFPLRLLGNGDLEILGTLSENSSRAVKEQIVELTTETILGRLKSLPVLEWSYQTNPGIRHVGPMAEEFHAAFSLGKDRTRISPRDLAGVALAAAKALNERLEHENANLRDQNKAIEARLERLEAIVNQRL